MTEHPLPEIFLTGAPVAPGPVDKRKVLGMCAAYVRLMSVSGDAAARRIADLLDRVGVAPKRKKPRRRGEPGRG